MEFNKSMPEVVAASAKKRLSYFKTWFLILLILGLLALIYVGYKAFFSPPTTPDNVQQSYSLDSFFVTTPYAQSPTPSPTSSPNVSPELKQKMMIGIVAVLALVLLGAFAAVLFAKDAAKVTVAGDVLKTLLGFFIGVATSFFGT